MGANGAGNVNIGGGGDGTGFNMAAMMASMAVGGAVGQNIAGAINNMMGGINQQTTPGAVPPPIPVVAYHVAINGQATGPFDLSVLTQMVAAEQFTADSLVWKNGMAQWAKAGTSRKACLQMQCRLSYHKDKHIKVPRHNFNVLWRGLGCRLEGVL